MHADTVKDIPALGFHTGQRTDKQLGDPGQRIAHKLRNYEMCMFVCACVRTWPVQAVAWALAACKHGSVRFQSVAALNPASAAAAFRRRNACAPVQWPGCSVLQGCVVCRNARVLRRGPGRRAPDFVDLVQKINTSRRQSAECVSGALYESVL